MWCNNVPHTWVNCYISILINKCKYLLNVNYEDYFKILP
jgi:hypothetical protein